MKPILSVSYNSNDRDECSEWQDSVTELVRIIVSGTGHLVGSKGHCGREIHGAVSSQQSQQQGQEEGEDTAVGVGFVAEQDQGELAKHNDKHEVPTENTENENIEGISLKWCAYKSS